MSEVVTPSPFPSRTNSMAPTSVHPSTVLESSLPGSEETAVTPADADKDTRVQPKSAAPSDGDRCSKGEWDPGIAAEPPLCVILNSSQ